jgi:membrane protein implicated in regulation of membrane protease activity
MLTDSASLLAGGGLAQVPPPHVVNWIIIGLLVVVLLLLLILALVLATYKRWLDRDNQHKTRVESQLDNLTEIVEQLAQDRGLPKRSGSLPPNTQKPTGSEAIRRGES